MYRIGDFSQIAQISIRMLRHYDKLGLLTPSRIDSLTGYRYYTLDQLSRLHRILALRDLGLTLEQIANLLDDPKADERLYKLLLEKQESINAQLLEEKARLDRVAARIQQMESIHETIPYDVALKELPAQRIAAVREVVPHLAQMADTREKMLNQLYETLANESIVPGIELAIYHLQEYTEADIDMSLAVEIEKITNLRKKNSPVKTFDLPRAASAASIIFQGNMRNLPEVVIHLYRWMGLNGYASSGPYREIHRSARELEIFATEPPADAVIEILVPVEKI